MPNLYILPKKGGRLLLGSLLLLTLQAGAQLKVGDNPTSVHKSSLLELEGSRQGLLLPRLADTTAINALNPPNGMLIFLTADGSLRIRSSGYWQKLANMQEAGANWALTGNSGTNPASQFLGTTDGKPLVVKTNNTERIRVTAAGEVGIGTATPGAMLEVSGTVKLPGTASATTEVEVLVLGTGGTVLKRTIPDAAFTNVIKAINGLQHQSLSLRAEASTTHNGVTVTNNSNDSSIAIYLPVQDGAGSSAKPYGLLTLTDWQKIQDGITTIQTGNLGGTATARGISITTAGSTRTIVLHPADATNPGVVTATAQTFGGDKTFQDDLSAATLKAGGSGMANSTLEVAGSMSTAIRTITSSTTLTDADFTVLANTTGGSITLTLPSPTGKTGRMYTIKKVGSGGIDNELVLNPNGATIDGGSSYTIYNDWTFVTLQNDGTNWFIIRK